MRPRWGGRERCRRVAIVGASATTCLLFCSANSALSQPIDPPPEGVQVAYGWREAWTGVDAARDQWLAYSGMTIAPWSRDIYSDGLRLRLGGGYGQYGYDIDPSRHDTCEKIVLGACDDPGGGKKHYKVGQTYAELLIGYYLRLGALTAKAFAGASMSRQKHITDVPKTADDNGNGDGTYVGAKAALELWLDINPKAWTSLDASYTTARDETSLRWRAGWRVTPQISVGPELRYNKNRETDDGFWDDKESRYVRYDWDGRAGLFGRYEWQGGELSLAGGFASPVENWTARDRSIYGTLNVLLQF